VTLLKRIIAGCGAVLLCGTAYAAASVQGFYDYKTYFTFNRLVELPGGRTLQPGKYVFRLIDSSSGRHIVQVLDEKETKRFATILAVAPRNEAVIFADTPDNAPRPIRYWYHSERTAGPIGYEFVYPEDQATRIASMTNQRVLMMDADVKDVDAMMRAQVRTVGPNRAAAKYRESVGPLARSASLAAAATGRETSAQKGFDIGRTKRSEVAGVQSVTLIGLTLLGGAALVALRVHRIVSRRPLERPLEQLGAPKSSRESHGLSIGKFLRGV
jgi:hypothetical protein